MVRLKLSLHKIIFEADTPAGRAFNILLMLTILGNSIVIIAESVEPLRLFCKREMNTFNPLSSHNHCYPVPFFIIIELLAV